MEHRLILDTDIGTDVDDLLTLAMIPGLPSVTLDAVTVVYGDTAVRAQMTAAACRRMGLHPSIHRGAEQPMSGKPVMWAGHEGVGFDGLETLELVPDDAVEVLADRATSSPGQFDVLAIGPLTNVAAAIERDPVFARSVRHLTVMGGEFARGWSEHNFTADSVATDIVVSSGIPMTIMPLDQTLRVMIDRDDLAGVAGTHPLGRVLLDEAERFWAWLGTKIPSFAGGASPAHDLMALLALVEPGWFRIEPVAVEPLESGVVDGRYRSAPDEKSPIGLVVDVDVSGVHDRLIEILAAAVGGGVDER